MVPALVTLLAVFASGPTATPGRSATAVRAEGAPPPALVTLSGPDDLVKLCKRIVPTERLRSRGDAVDRGEEVAAHDVDRSAALLTRYALALPAGKVAFAPYDGPEQRLSVSEPAMFRLSPAVMLFATEDRDLPVQVNAAVARRILTAQAAGRLSLRLTFDLPDEGVCTSDRRERHFTIGVEPVEWAWYEGDAQLALGGVAADRPAVSLAGGAEAKVDVGEPIAGPSEARKAVLARKPDLVTCYADGLRRAPSLDGVVVVDLGTKVAVSADSTGSPELARCVERALGPLAGGPRASVPIRFELSLPRPGAEPAGATGAATEPAAAAP